MFDYGAFADPYAYFACTLTNQLVVQYYYNTQVLPCTVMLEATVLKYNSF